MPPRRFALRLNLALPLLLVLSAVVSNGPMAAAEVVTIDFNSLGNGQSDGAITSYLQGIINTWNPGGSVTVSGARVQTNYTGDNHAVGPVINGIVKPITLGTSDGGVLHPGGGFDSFIANEGSDRITISFNGMKVYEVSFDFQIFPDGTLPDGTNTDPSNPDWPDFKFRADGDEYIHQFGIMPGEDGTFPHSPFSGPNDTELAPQYIGHSGVFYFPNGVSVLEFIDWPRMIGIDNLRLSNAPQDAPPVPEPSSFLVWSLALGGGVFVSVRLRRQPAPVLS